MDIIRYYWQIAWRAPRDNLVDGSVINILDPVWPFSNLPIYQDSKQEGSEPSTLGCYSVMENR